MTLTTSIQDVVMLNVIVPFRLYHGTSLYVRLTQINMQSCAILNYSFCLGPAAVAQLLEHSDADHEIEGLNLATNRHWLKMTENQHNNKIVATLSITAISIALR